MQTVQHRRKNKNAKKPSSENWPAHSKTIDQLVKNKIKLTLDLEEAEQQLSDTSLYEAGKCYNNSTSLCKRAVSQVARRSWNGLDVHSPGRAWAKWNRKWIAYGAQSTPDTNTGTTMAILAFSITVRKRMRSLALQNQFHGNVNLLLLLKMAWWAAIVFLPKKMAAVQQQCLSRSETLLHCAIELRKYLNLKLSTFRHEVIQLFFQRNNSNWSRWLHQLSASLWQSTISTRIWVLSATWRRKPLWCFFWNQPPVFNRCLSFYSIKIQAESILFNQLLHGVFL